MHVRVYDFDGAFVVCAEFFDPYPHYTEIYYNQDGPLGGYDEIKSTSIETWGATERR